MRRFALLALVSLALFPHAIRAADEPAIQVAIAKDKDSKPAATFPADVPQLYAFFRSDGTKQGDKLRGVWIASDVGDAAPKDTKIDELTLTADKDNAFGAFSLSKPTKGWPVGKYRVEVYDNGELVTIAHFTIEAAGAKKDSDEKKD